MGYMSLENFDRYCENVLKTGGSSILNYAHSSLK